MSFASLKKKSGSFDKLTQQIEKMSKPQGAGPDERLWKPGVDKSGNGYAVIRFLPEPEGEDLPWAQVWSHAFQGPGGWYIENSLTTLGQKDPVGELNRTLWNSGLDSDKEIARKQKRKLSYYSNIYVVKDQLNPQNEGKVFLYKYGKKIHDKIVSSMQPQFEDEEPINPFDLWSGADFRIKIQTIGGYWNYDKSDFAAPSTLGGFDDEKLEALWKSQHSLKEFTDPSAFKSYEKLEERLNLVLNKGRTQVRTRDEQDEAVFDSPVGGFNDRDITPVAPVSQPDTTPSGFGAKIEELNKADDGPDLDYFAALANDD
jgi:hypothetical protein|tara:strand:- start:1100 stop:2044 length:945 start_codon:yes stop_codon:yes gene_type:complete